MNEELLLSDEELLAEYMELQKAINDITFFLLAQPNPPDITILDRLNELQDALNQFMSTSERGVPATVPAMLASGGKLSAKIISSELPTTLKG